MKYRFYLSLIFAVLNVCGLQAQGLLSEKMIFTQQDTLRGSITPERIWWDLTYYHLELEVVPDENSSLEKTPLPIRSCQNTKPYKSIYKRL